MFIRFPRISANTRNLLLLLFVTLFVLFSYTFFHEAGHALVGLLSGGRLSGFSLNFFDLSAHVNLDGDFNRVQSILINIAGSGLPLLIWVGLLLASPMQANPAIEGLKIIATLVTLNTLLAWIVLPLLFLAGKAPQDDVTSFLRNSGLNPWLVSLLASVIYITGWLLFARKTIGLRRALAFLKNTDQGLFTPAARKSVFGMVVLLGLLGLTGFAANGFRLATQETDRFLPPAGYYLVHTIDLSEKPHEQDPLYAFTLDQSKVAGVYLLVKNINTQYVDVTLVGPDNYRSVILHGEGYAAFQDSPHMKELLQPGQYQVLLTSRQSPGIISVYVIH